MAHVTLVLSARGIDMNGDILTDEALLLFARQLEEKYGKAAVKVHNGNLKVAIDGPQCICGKRDCYGPEHQLWCPLWNETEINDDTQDEKEPNENDGT